MASKYRLQIVEADTGKIVHGWAPGLAAEVEFVQNLTARTMTFATNVITVTNGSTLVWSGLAWGT